METAASLAVWFLVAANAHGNAPEQLADPDRIQALIGQLDDDDFRTRDRAARGLRQIGHGALGMLETAAKQGTFEVRERTERLARDIRSESYLPGKHAEGMQATLRTSSEVFRAEQPIAMQLEIKNISEADFMLPKEVRWGYSMTYGPDKHRVLGLYVPCHVYIEVHQLSGRKAARNMSPIACGHPGYGDPEPVKAGNSMIYTVPATLVAPLLPGEYEIRVMFQTIYMNTKVCKESMKAMAMMGEAADHTIRQVKEHSLTSNTIRFTVE